MGGQVIGQCLVHAAAPVPGHATLTAKLGGNTGLERGIQAPGHHRQGDRRVEDPWQDVDIIAVGPVEFPGIGRNGAGLE